MFALLTVTKFTFVCSQIWPLNCRPHQQTLKTLNHFEITSSEKKLALDSFELYIDM